MKRIKLVVAYDGTDYCGWARQASSLSIQDKIESAISDFLGYQTFIQGASRTDSGAHADHQVCHFDTTHPVDPHKWSKVINNRLPSDIRIVQSTLVSSDFDSRFSAKKRYYRYTIAVVASENPLRNRYRFEQFKCLNVQQMKYASKVIVGKYDFRGFSEQMPSSANTIRTIYSVDIIASRSEIYIDIVGNAFIRGMMRRISGGLYEVGLGIRSIHHFESLLDSTKRDQLQWPIVLPAKGLCLKKIYYGRHPKDFRK